MKYLNVAILTWMVIDSAHHLHGQAGTLDPSFGGDGIVTTDIALNSDLGLGVVQQPDGKVLCAGYGIDPVTGADVIIARYNADGTLDNTFSGDGKVQSDFGSDERGRAILLQPDGKIIVGGGYFSGATSNDFMLVRYNADGTLDNTFGGGDGIAIADHAGSTDTGYGCTLQPDGKILVCGGAIAGAINHIAVLRFNADGTLDTGFGVNGWALADFGATATAEGRQMGLQADGKIVACGFVLNAGDYDVALARFNADGTADAGFNTTGTWTMQLSALTDLLEDVAVQADGKIVATGGTRAGPTDDFVTMRLNSDGSIDNTFDVDGMVVTDIDGGSDGARALVLQPDGKIVVAGVGAVVGNINFALVRYNANGSFDNGFNGGAGLTTVDLNGGSDYGTCVALQSDGKILVGGYGLVTGDVMAVARFDGGAVGVEEINGFGTVALIYPNPAVDRATLEYELTSTRILSCELFNAQGRVVRTLFSNALRGVGPQRETVDLSSLPAGPYTLTFADGTRKVSVQVTKQ